MIVTSNPLLAEKARKFSGLGYSHLTSKAGKANLSEESIKILITIDLAKLVIIIEWLQLTQLLD